MTPLMMSLIHQVFGEECEQAKPHPAPYSRGLELLGLHASEGLAFEDSPIGIASARAALLPFVGVTTGQLQACIHTYALLTCFAGLKSERLLDLGASHTISDYTCPQLLGIFPSDN